MVANLPEVVPLKFTKEKELVPTLKPLSRETLILTIKERKGERGRERQGGGEGGYREISAVLCVSAAIQLIKAGRARDFEIESRGALEHAASRNAPFNYQSYINISPLSLTRSLSF
jgi:hypothetical protein